MLFLKDRRSRFTRVNQAFLTMHGCRSQSDVMGRNDHDFHPPALAAHYIAEDERVMRSGRPMRDQAWLVPDHTGLPAWYRCTKLPLVDAAGRVSGLAGILRPFAHAGSVPDAYCRLTPALQMVAADYHRPLRVSHLTRACGFYDQSHFTKAFKSHTGLPPQAYRQRARAGHA